MKRQIVNIINFIRNVEPRSDVDLVETVRGHINGMLHHKLKGTFLLQYDALENPVYTDMLKQLDTDQFEFGVWLEIVQPQCEAVGIPWTGRYPWDWHVHCGFSVGYTKSEREKLVDVLFEKFREIFGKYPRVFGSWFFDSHTARYICDKYGIDAMCNCKEQYGTDGYTLWGGYYGQGYYPSRKNVFMPAQTLEEQLDTPLFRMLGSDPIYQYDIGMSADSGASSCQGVVTLEPACGDAGGGVPRWVDWYMNENFNGECLSFGYAQTGQENSFPWPNIKNGMEYQYSVFEKLESEGKITVEKLGETGLWFKEKWKNTPASSITAHTAWDDEYKNSVWYSGSNYRINLYSDHGLFRIRDIHVFDENFTDPFEYEVCKANDAAYETLPVVDGNRHSGSGVVAGIRIMRDGKPLTAEKMIFSDMGQGTAHIDYGTFSITLSDDRFCIESDGPFTAEYKFGKKDAHIPQIVSSSEKKLLMSFKCSEYGLELTDGAFCSALKARSDNDRIEALIFRKNSVHI